MRAIRSNRVTIDPSVTGAKACIRGLRFPACRLLGLLAAGRDEVAILAECPYLGRYDVQAALTRAAALMEEQVVEPAAGIAARHAELTSCRRPADPGPSGYCWAGEKGSTNFEPVWSSRTGEGGT